MAKIKKAAKKFQKKHLARTLEQRKKAKEGKRFARPKRAEQPQGDEHPDDGHPDEAPSDNSDAEGGFSASDDSDVEKAPVVKRPKAQKTKSASNSQDAASHKAQLDELKETDPEFFKFLQENDSELLDFGDDDDDDEVDEGELSGGEENDEDDGDADENDEEANVDDAEAAEEEEDVETLTHSTLDSWESNLNKSKSLKLVKKMLLALKAAEQFAEGEGDEDVKYRFDDQEVISRLVSICVTEIPPVLDHHLPDRKPTSKGKESLPSTSPRWTKVQPTVKSYLNHVLRVSKQFKDPALQHFMLRNFVPILPFFACFPKLSRDLLRRMLDIWASGDEKARVSAFLAIRKLSTYSLTLLTLVMKKSYHAFTTLAANTNSHTWTSIQFMRDCVAELYALNPLASYQHAFVYIRQLAVTLRTAITTRTKDAYKAVYNWQFIHCVRLWAKVLSNQQGPMKGSKVSLADLVYPFTQVTLGTCRLLSSPQYFPLRFQCIRALLDLSEATGTYIPIVPYLIEVLDSSEVADRAKPSTLKALDFRLLLKAQKPYLHTITYQDGLVQEIMYLLLRFFSIHGKSIAFPEIATPAVIHLKRLAKKTRNGKLSKQAKMLVEKLEQNAKFIEEQRSKVDFAPTDAGKAKTFLADMAANQVPVMKHFDSVNKMRARVEGTMAANDDQPSQSRKRSADGSDDRGKAKKAKKGQGTEKLKRVVAAADDEDEDDVVEDFTL